jgi:hypothetical protein
MADSEQPDASAGARERALDQREVNADARDAAQAARIEKAETILADADRRDDEAEARDVVAEGRDAAASLDSFMRDEIDEYDAAHKARRAGALDRRDSKDDRVAAADDREHLSEGGKPAESKAD